jgi:hypothetical protein
MISVLAMLLFLSAPTVAHPGEAFAQFAGFSLGHATLADVQSRYGKSPRLESGQGGEHEVWVCYATPTAEVQFKSGELGGGTRLLAFVLRKLSNNSNCPKPTKPIHPSIGGISLGTTRRQFENAVGSGLTWSGHTGRIIFEHQAKSSTRVTYDVSTTVTGTFQNGRLTKLEVWKVVTN